jgi:hypothetical protein
MRENEKSRKVEEQKMSRKNWEEEQRHLADTRKQEMEDREKKLKD